MAAVIIRSSRHQEPVLLRKPPIVRLHGRVVIGMRRFEGVEPGGRQAGDAIVLRADARMRQRCQAAGRVKHLNDGRGWRAATGDERRTLELEITREGLVAGPHVSRGDERRGDLGAPDTLAAPGRVDDRLRVDRRTKPRQSIPHLFDAANAVGALRLKKRLQRRRVDVEEISEHVDVAAAVHRADFDAWDEVNACRARGGLRLADACKRVVIGNADDGEPGGLGRADQVRRRKTAVGRGGVKVKVDQRRTATR